MPIFSFPSKIRAKKVHYTRQNMVLFIFLFRTSSPVTETLVFLRSCSTLSSFPVSRFLPAGQLQPVRPVSVPFLLLSLPLDLSSLQPRYEPTFSFSRVAATVPPAVNSIFPGPGVPSVPPLFGRHPSRSPAGLVWYLSFCPQTLFLCLSRMVAIVS